MIFLILSVVMYYIKLIPLRWNKFRITYFEYSFFIQFNIIIECNDLGLVRLGTDRMLRLELMKKLKDEGYNSKEISEFLSVNGIRPLRTNNPYSPQLVWVTLNKYEKRLKRVGNTKLISFKETLYVQPNTKGL